MKLNRAQREIKQVNAEVGGLKLDAERLERMAGRAEAAAQEQRDEAARQASLAGNAQRHVEALQTLLQAQQAPPAPHRPNAGPATSGNEGG